MQSAATKLLSLAVGSALLVFSAGCSSKNYVKKQTAPIIDKTNELNEMTAKNTNDIKDTDARATKGIADVNTKADAVNQKALAAGKQADEAQTLAQGASTGANKLATTVANLDNYHSVVETSVHFAFGSANLSKKAKGALDELASEIDKNPHYVLTVTGGADSVGGADANYELSQKRAEAVIQYLAQNYSVPSNKFYLVGLGKDKPVASNKNDAGRAKNRRVDIKLMTNTVEEPTAAQAQPTQK